jgi:hypothetical protein
MKNINDFVYFSIKPHPLATGVSKKLFYSINSLRSLGFKADLILFESNSFGLFLLIKELLFCDSKNIILRFPGVMRTILLFPFVLYKRIFTKNIILEIPTPLSVAVGEFKSNSPFFKSFCNITFLYLFYPLVLIPYSRLIQSAQESRYFLRFVKNKTIFVGNGIDTASVPFSNHIKIFIGGKIVFIAVAQIEIWHGFDRILYGLKNYYDLFSDVCLNIEIVIVGDGPDRKSLIELSMSLGLEKYVRFPGNLTGIELDTEFNNSNIAISSLGSYRVNLFSSSPLKSREYAARGFPFISADNDADFPASLPFVYNVSNDSSPLNFSLIVDWYRNLIQTDFDSLEIRKFAESNLDFKIKIKDMFLSFFLITLLA